jgi:hypothetical protein
VAFGDRVAAVPFSLPCPERHGRAFTVFAFGGRWCSIGRMSLYRRIRPGNDIDAYCTRCKMDLTHTILSLAGEELPERVRCNTCGSEHRYIPERVAGAPRKGPTASGSAVASTPARREVSDMNADELLGALRELLQAAGATTVPRIGRKWEGGTLVMRPGKPGLQEKEVPIDAFFRKIVMVRDRLRVLEQHINSAEGLSDAERLGLQQYITRCYGSLTTFNVLFDDKEDWFVGDKK